MSGRIRTLKPEILDDERTAGLTHEAFRPFVGMVTLADDYGNLHGNEKKVEASVFWARECLAGISRIVLELVEAELIDLYAVRNQTYVHLRGWSKHQRVDKPGKPRVPGPELGETIGLGYIRESVANPSREPRELVAPDLDLDLRSGSPIPTPSGSRAHEGVHPVGDLSKASWTDEAVVTVETSTGKRPADVASVWAHFVATIGPERALTRAEWLKWLTREVGGKNAKLAGTASTPLTACYAAAIAKGIGGAWALSENHDAELDAIWRTHGISAKTGLHLGTELRDTWLAEEAEGFARTILNESKAEPKKRGWYSDFKPRGFLKYLNEITTDEASRAEVAPLPSVHSRYTALESPKRPGGPARPKDAPALNLVPAIGIVGGDS